MSKNGSISLTSKTTGMTRSATVWGSILLIALFVFWYAFQPILAPFFVSAVIAFALHPLLEKLQKLGMGRTLSSTLMITLVLAVLCLVVLIAGPKIVAEANQLITSLPKALANFLSYLQSEFSHFIPGIDALTSQDIGGKLQENIGKISSVAVGVILKALSGTLAVANLIATLLLMPLLIFYFLRDWPNMVAFFHKLLPKVIQEPLMDLFDKILVVIKHYFRGVLSVVAVMSVYYTCALLLLGSPFAVTLGLLSGLLMVIPYVGFFVTFVVALALNYPGAESLLDLWPIVAVYMVAQVAESFILTPKLVGDKVGLHPLWVLFALMGGGFLFGFLGILFSIPVAACLAVILRFAINKYLQQLNAKGAVK